MPLLCAALFSLPAAARQDGGQVNVRFQETPPRVQGTIRRELGEIQQRRMQEAQRLLQELQRELGSLQKGAGGKRSAAEMEQRREDLTRRIDKALRVMEESQRALDNPRMEIKWRMRNGRPAYEVDTDLLGRSIELFIAEDGKLLRRRDELDEKDLPKAVLDTLRREVGEKNLEDIDNVLRYTENRVVWYEIEIDRRKGEDMTFWITADGKLLNKREH
jgi:hypothetical protein